MTRRRSKGEGSIYRRKDGLWVAQYKVQTHKGKKTKYIYSKTKKEVAAKLTKAIVDRNFGVVVDAGSLKAGDYLDNWLNPVRDTVKDRTWQRHKEVVRLHLKPFLGQIRLNRLEGEMVSNADLQRFRLSRSGSGSPFRASRVAGRAWSRYYRAGTPSYLSSEGPARFLYRSLQNSPSRTSPIVIEICHGLRPFPLRTSKLA